MRREIATPPHPGQRPGRKVALWTPWGVMLRDERAKDNRESARPDEKQRRQPALRSRPTANGMPPMRRRAPEPLA